MKVNDLQDKQVRVFAFDVPDTLGRRSLRGIQIVSLAIASRNARSACGYSCLSDFGFRPSDLPTYFLSQPWSLMSCSS